MKRIDTVYDNSSVAFSIDNLNGKDSVHIMIGIADNGTLAIWNNADGEQINVPLSELSAIHDFQKMPLRETRDVIDYTETCGITSHHEYNPAYGTCPFCGNHVIGRNMDFWNGKVVCKCGAVFNNGKATK